MCAEKKSRNLSKFRDKKNQGSAFRALQKLIIASFLLLPAVGVAVADEAGEFNKAEYEAVARSNSKDSIQDAARSRLPVLERLYKVKGSMNFIGHGFDKEGKPAAVFVVVICSCGGES